MTRRAVALRQFGARSVRGSSGWAERGVIERGRPTSRPTAGAVSDQHDRQAARGRRRGCSEKGASPPRRRAADWAQPSCTRPAAGVPCRAWRARPARPAGGRGPRAAAPTRRRLRPPPAAGAQALGPAHLQPGLHPAFLASGRTAAQRLRGVRSAPLRQPAPSAFGVSHHKWGGQRRSCAASPASGESEMGAESEQPLGSRRSAGRACCSGVAQLLLCCGSMCEDFHTMTMSDSVSPRTDSAERARAAAACASPHCH